MGKRFKANSALVNPDKNYSTDEAFTLIDQMAPAKFDEAVDVAIRLGIDPRKSDQMVRGSISLPHGLGKNVRVLVFAVGEKAKEALAAGADFVGAEDLVEKITKGWLDFDKAVASPDQMLNVSKVGKILGPRGLMPNPKLGTVTADVTKAVRELKAGRVEYRVEKGAIVHAPIGKKSFGKTKLAENFQSLFDAVMKAKPPTAKGQYVRSVSVSTTMGPGISINIGEAV